MSHEISLQRCTESRLASVDFDNLVFGKTFSDHMFEVDYINGQWVNAAIKPYGPIQLEPSNTGIHYGQSIFEGMKATLHQDGRAMLWRPEEHSRRLNASARRLAMPEFPEDLFLQAVHKLVSLDKSWIPAKEGSALYIRPFMFGNDNSVGVRPSNNYKFMVITSPVGPYYNKPVRLLAQTEYVRAVLGGVGEAKAAGNYAAAMLPTALAQDRGFDQILWLDARHQKYVQEVGTMNIFFVLDGKIVTPSTPGTILKGITRKTIIQFLQNAGHEVEERLIDIHELVDAHKEGKIQEAFGTGTAAVVSQVSSIEFEGYQIDLPPIQPDAISSWVKNELNGVRSGRLPDVNGWLVEAGTYKQMAVVV